MPRHARCFSSSGFYHIILRGINKQSIFEEPRDYAKFLFYLEACVPEQNACVHTFCLMSNHVHLLLSVPAEKLSLLMKKIGIRYAIYFNKKYDRCGHLFQDRFISEAVESESYLLTVMRYILNNPVHTGLFEVGSYFWSSYTWYGQKRRWFDASIFVPLLGDYSNFDQYMHQETDELAMDFERMTSQKDCDAIKKARELLGVSELSRISSLPCDERNDAIGVLLQTGMSCRQISRITGVSREVIRKIGRR